MKRKKVLPLTKKKQKLKLIFCLQINIKGDNIIDIILTYYHTITDTIILGVYGKYAVSWQYFKKELSDEVDFLHTEKHAIFLQINTMTLFGMVTHSQTFKNSKFVLSLQYFRK